MVQGQINWKQGDYIRLGQAVAQFNRKINQIKTEENKLYLPEEVEYTKLKQNIITRNELNRIINSLRRFNTEGAEDLYETDSGEMLTKWERKELGIQKQIITTRINKEIQKLNEPISGGYSRAQMGSQELQQLLAQKRNLEKLETVTGQEFERLKNRIRNLGSSDYNMRKAITYRKNVIEQLEELKNGYSEFQEIYDLLDKIKNPVKFYETMQKSRVLEDFFSWYINPEGYGSFRDVGEIVDYIKTEYELS